MNTVGVKVGWSGSHIKDLCHILLGTYNIQHTATLKGLPLLVTRAHCRSLWRWCQYLRVKAACVLSLLAMIQALVNTEKKPQVNGYASPSHLSSNISNHAAKQSKLECFFQKMPFPLWFILFLLIYPCSYTLLSFSCGGLFEDGWQDAISEGEAGGEGEKPW